MVSSTSRSSSRPSAPTRSPASTGVRHTNPTRGHRVDAKPKNPLHEKAVDPFHPFKGTSVFDGRPAVDPFHPLDRTSVFTGKPAVDPFHPKLG